MIDLKKFKKVSSDKHTTVMRHEDGHELKVVHSVLSPKLRKDVEKLPMADGGEVKKEKPPPPQPPQPRPPVNQEEAKKVQESFNKSLGFARGAFIQGQPNPGDTYGSISAEDYFAPKPSVQGNLEDIGIPKSSVGSQLGESGVPVSEEIKHEDIFKPEQSSLGQAAGEAAVSGLKGVIEQTPQTPDSYVKIDGKTYATSPGGPEKPQENPLLKQLNDIAKPNPELSRQTQQALQSNIDQNAQISQNFMNSKAKIDSEHQALVHDIMNNHINMGDYWKHNDKGAAALGAFLGGMGSGLTGHANPVPGMIANSQENFLKAEMANLDNPKSLLSAVQAQYGNNRDAADVMRIISNEALNAHLQKVMAPLNSATAQANAAQVQMQLMQNTESLKQQMAMRQAMAAGGSNMDPSMAVRFLVPPDRQKEVFDEIGKAQNAKNNEANLMGMFDAMDKENTIMGRAGRLGATPPSVSAFEANILPIIRDKEGRVNEFELEAVRKLEPKPGDKPSTVIEKRVGTQKFLQDKQSAPTAKGFGIDLDKFSSTSTAPSVETATMNGKLYRKVPGGWAPVQ